MLAEATRTSPFAILIGYSKVRGYGILSPRSQVPTNSTQEPKDEEEERQAAMQLFLLASPRPLPTRYRLAASLLDRVLALPLDPIASWAWHLPRTCGKSC
jgi:hypothetical protein